MHKYDVTHTITSITLYQFDTSYDMFTEYNTPVPV